MEIETERLLLRPWRESDAEALFSYASDPDVGPRAGWPPHQDIVESLLVIRTVFSNDHTWAIELKESGETIGCIGYFLYGESNIAIGENDAEIGYGFNVKGFEVLWSDFFVDNPASGRVMEKCGFRDTGEFNWCSHLYRGDEITFVLNMQNDAIFEYLVQTVFAN